jgi:hypothetical protein
MTYQSGPPKVPDPSGLGRKGKSGPGGGSGCGGGKKKDEPIKKEDTCQGSKPRRCLSAVCQQDSERVFSARAKRGKDLHRKAR